MQSISTEFQPLFAGTEEDGLSTSVTIASGQVLKRGAVIGKATATGKGYLLDKTKNDGSQVANLILAEDVDASAGDVVAVAYKSGIFNVDALSTADGTDVQDHSEELRLVDIYLRANY